MYNFLLLSSLNHAGGFSGQTNVLKQHIAMLKYLVRGTVLLAAVQHCASALPRDQRPVITLASLGLYGYVSHDVSPGAAHTPFRVLRLLSGMLSKVEPLKQDPQIYWQSSSFDELQLSRTGVIVSWARHLRPVARGLFSDLRNSMGEALCGCSIEFVLSTCIKDNLSNTSAGYWGGAGVLPKHSLLLRHFLTSALTQKRFFFVGGGDSGTNNIRWKMGALQQWLGGPVRAFELAIMNAVHMTAGMPPRCQEYTSMLLRNTSEQKRSVMWLENQSQFVMQRYHKTRMVKQADE